MRIFQGVTGQAGQPGSIASGLRKLGMQASAVSIQDHKFGYEPDIRLKLDSSLENTFSTVQALADEFDVFHFHARSFLSEWPQQTFPSMLDLLVLKERRKKIFFHFRGQEIRLASKFQELNRFHYVSGAHIVPRVLHSEDWPMIGVSNRSVPRIVHAPSRRGVKGTQALLDALDLLKAEGVKFHLDLVEGVSHEEAKKIYREADIIVDQLRIGWYGVLATEAMAMGKPTVAYIRDDLWESHGWDMPIVNANPDNIGEILLGLIHDLPRRQAISLKSREYFLRTHSSDAVCSQLIQTYNSTPLQPVDWAAVGRFMDRQHNVHTAKAAAIIKSMKKQFKRMPTKSSYSPLNRVIRYYRTHGFVSTLRAIAYKLSLSPK